jgi:hypothetical protein
VSPESFVVGGGVRAAAEVEVEFAAAKDAVESELEMEILISAPYLLPRIGGASNRMSPSTPILTKR